MTKDQLRKEMTEVLKQIEWTTNYNEKKILLNHYKMLENEFNYGKAFNINKGD